MLDHSFSEFFWWYIVCFQLFICRKTRTCTHTQKDEEEDLMLSLKKKGYHIFRNLNVKGNVDSPNQTLKSNFIMKL